MLQYQFQVPVHVKTTKIPLFYGWYDVHTLMTPKNTITYKHHNNTKWSGLFPFIDRHLFMYRIIFGLLHYSLDTKYHSCNRLAGLKLFKDMTGVWLGVSSMCHYTKAPISGTHMRILIWWINQITNEHLYRAFFQKYQNVDCYI